MRTRSEPRFRRNLHQRRTLPPPPHRRQGAPLTSQRLRDVAARPAFRPRRRGLGGLVTLGILLGVMFVVALSSVLLQQIYAGKIYPRVTVNGYPLDGQTPQQGRAYLHTIEGAQIHTPFMLQGNGRTWTVTPAQFGAHYNVDAAVRAAYAVGRQGSWPDRLLEQVNILLYGVSITMHGAHDDTQLAAFVTRLAPSLFVAPQPAEVGASGDGVAILHEPIAGQRLDVSHSLVAIGSALDTHQLAPIDLPMVVINSAISHAVAQAAVRSTLALLSGPVTLTYPNAPNPWVLKPHDLARLLTFTPTYSHGNWTLQSGIDLKKLGVALRPVALSIYKPPHDATYVVAGTYVTVLPDLAGYALDVPGTANALLALQNSAAGRGINVPTRAVTAQFTAEKAVALNFNRLMSQTQTSWQSLAQAADPVIAQDTAHNVALAAGLLDNVRLAPGKVFTYTTAVGPVNGVHDYYPGLNKIGAADVAGVNGGTFRVASALYQAAFSAGLAIERRVAPLYSTDGMAQIGLDALAYDVPGGPDLVIKNTTDHDVLIKTAVDQQALTVKVYLFNTATALARVDIGTPYLVTHPDGAVDVTYSRQVGVGLSIDGDNVVTHYRPLETP